MSTAIQTTNGASHAPIITSNIEAVLIQGDLKGLNEHERVAYYMAVCNSVGLNPLTQPFDYVTFQGKLTLYAKKSATDQLRVIHGVSVESLEGKMVDDCYVVTAKGKTGTGRLDAATGAVSMGSLKGEAKCNALMKAETKAKRRLTLSLCGLGLLDDSEVDSIPGAQRMNFAPAETATSTRFSAEHADAETGEIIEERDGKISNDQAAAISREAMSVQMKIGIITDAYDVIALQEIDASEYDTILEKIYQWAAKRDARRAEREGQL